ncbi:23S rRNA (guanosine(2251)-2'-O)-methyltransferase RlmB [Pyruvatibacter sp.]|uniref:23S rRNA (guanosine(2251)-2'-O)-methyltransferase RlmB n=1 Tax=Pyruvatibacter sp. TaxID=1981328 RepID=UPI0032EFAEDC
MSDQKSGNGPKGPRGGGPGGGKGGGPGGGPNRGRAGGNRPGRNNAPGDVRGANREGTRDGRGRDRGPSSGGRKRPPTRTTERAPERAASRGRSSSAASDGPDWLYGTHAVRAALHNPKRRVLRLIATPAGAEAVAESAQKRGLQIETTDAREMDKLFPAGTVHQGLAIKVAPLAEPVLADVLARAEAEAAEGAATPATGQKPLIILDQVTDPQNVGAVLRSAAVFGARAVIVTRRNSPPITGALAKAASGAVEQMPLVQVPNVAQAIAVLQAEGWFTVGLEGTGDKALGDLDLTGKIAIVMGAEGTGLRRLTAERCDMLAKIPGEPGFASLNVSNATAVALYEIRRQAGGTKA